MRDASPRSDADPQKIMKGLSDPMFASKLDRMEKLAGQNASNISLGKMMYENKNQGTINSSLYDYQKIQSTHHNSQIRGQRDFLMGGPSSGFHSSIIGELHKKR